MAYTLNKPVGASGPATITIPPNAINTVYWDATNKVGIQYVGQNATDYGTAIAQNTLQMVSNFAGSARPNDNISLQGQLWFNTTGESSGDLYVRTSSVSGAGAAGWSRLLVVDGAGNTVIPGNQDVTGNLEVGGGISVTSNSNFGGDLITVGDLNVGGNLDVSGIITVDGVTSATDLLLSSTGNIYMESAKWPKTPPDVGQFLGVSSQNVLEYLPFVYATTTDDNLIVANLISAYPGIKPGQKVVGPTVIYECVGAANSAAGWRIAAGGVKKTGDTMTGALILNADPTLPLGAATKQYVDSTVAPTEIPWTMVTDTPTTVDGYGITDALETTGGTMNGPLILGKDATDPLEAVPLRQVNAVATHQALVNIPGWVKTPVDSPAGGHLIEQWLSIPFVDLSAGAGIVVNFNYPVELDGYIGAWTSIHGTTVHSTIAAIESPTLTGATVRIQETAASTQVSGYVRILVKGYIGPSVPGNLIPGPPAPPAAPVANFIANSGPGNTYDFTDTSTGNPTSWLWNFGDGTTSTQQNPTHGFTYSAPGSGNAEWFTVTLTATNVYGSDTETKVNFILLPSYDTNPGG